MTEFQIFKRVLTLFYNNSSDFYNLSKDDFHCMVVIWGKFVHFLAKASNIACGRYCPYKPNWILGIIGSRLKKLTGSLNI